MITIKRSWRKRRKIKSWRCLKGQIIHKASSREVESTYSKRKGERQITSLLYSGYRMSSYRLLQVWDSNADDHRVACWLLHGCSCTVATLCTGTESRNTVRNGNATVLFPGAAAVSAGPLAAVCCVCVRVCDCVWVCVCVLLLVLPWRARWLMFAGCRTQRHAPC